MEILWAGWRAAYMRGLNSETPVPGTPDGPDAGCLFCRLPGTGTDDETLIVERGEMVYSVMNLYPYTTGHLMVTPFRHVGTPGELNSDEQSEMWEMVSRAQTALENTIGPDAFNLGANLGRDAGAGVLGHLHLHLVPRWRGDANFMTTSANARILPESIPDTRARLVEALRSG